MADDGGVLGNLPSTRPGKRSAKREEGGRAKREPAGRPAQAADRAAAKAEASGKAAAKPPRTPKAARTSAKPGARAAGAASPRGRTGAASAGAPRRPSRQVEPEPSGDPLTAAARTAAGLAVTGVRIAGTVTQELLRRLPRP